MFIGAGNLATNLAKKLKANKVAVRQVYSRTIESARSLALKVDCEYTNDLTKVCSEVDFYFIALKDSVIDQVLSKIKFNGKLLIHGSGSTSMKVLQKFSENIASSS